MVLCLVEPRVSRGVIASPSPTAPFQELIIKMAVEGIVTEIFILRASYLERFNRLPPYDIHLDSIPSLYVGL